VFVNKGSLATPFICYKLTKYYFNNVINKEIMNKVGFSRESRTTSLKEFTPNVNHLGGLCAGAITNIALGEADFTNSKSEFWTGHTVPRLTINIESRLDPDGVKKSYYTESFMPPAWTPDLLPDGKMSFRLGSDESKLGHILETIKGSFADSNCWTDEEMASLSTDLTLMDDDKMFISREPEEIIVAYTKFYQAIVDIIENKGKPLFNDKNGKPKIYWLKLLYTVKGANINNGKVGFPSYADTGFIEEATKDAKGVWVQPTIKIQVNKQESIDPTSVAVKGKAKPNGAGVVANAVAEQGSDAAAGNAAIPDWMK